MKFGRYFSLQKVWREKNSDKFPPKKYIFGICWYSSVSNPNFNITKQITKMLPSAINPICLHIRFKKRLQIEIRFELDFVMFP